MLSSERINPLNYNFSLHAAIEISSSLAGFSRSAFFLMTRRGNMHIVFIAITQPLCSLHQLMTATDASFTASIPLLHRLPMSWFGFSADINVWWGLIPVDPPYCGNRERSLVIGKMNPEVELIVLRHSGSPMGNGIEPRHLICAYLSGWLHGWLSATYFTCKGKDLGFSVVCLWHKVSGGPGYCHWTLGTRPVP